MLVSIVSQMDFNILTSIHGQFCFIFHLQVQTVDRDQVVWLVLQHQIVSSNSFRQHLDNLGPFMQHP